MGARVVLAGGRHFWRASLPIPELELRQQLPEVRLHIGVRHGLGKVVAGHSLAVVHREIQGHSFGKTLAADKRLHHAHDFCAFFINRYGVEVVDLLVLVGPHRVRHGARVFWELRSAQHTHIFNSLDSAGRGLCAQILAELLITKYCQTFLE